MHVFKDIILDALAMAKHDSVTDMVFTRCGEGEGHYSDDSDICSLNICVVPM